MKTRAHDGESATHWPANTTNKIKPTPINDASSTRPGRTKRKYTPTSSAIGIVMARVNVAHGDDFSAFTTTSATTPSKITMMARTASCAMNPPRLLTSSRAICPIDLPSRRIEQNKMMKSCTHPAHAAPAISHSVPGKYPNCAASVGPTSGPGPAIAAKWCPNKTHLLVGTKSRPSSRRSEGVARVSSNERSRAARNAEYSR